MNLREQRRKMERTVLAIASEYNPEIAVKELRQLQATIETACTRLLLKNGEVVRVMNMPEQADDADHICTGPLPF